MIQRDSRNVNVPIKMPNLVQVLISSAFIVRTIFTLLDKDWKEKYYFHFKGVLLEENI